MGGGRSDKCRVGSEQKRKARRNAASRWPFLVLTVPFIYRGNMAPGRFVKIFWQRLLFLRSPGGIRCIREPAFCRRPVGFPRVSTPGLGRNRLALALMDRGDG